MTAPQFEHSRAKHGTLKVRPGKPLQFEPSSSSEQGDALHEPILDPILETFVAYREAAAKLVTGKYSNLREVAPIHMRFTCDVFVYLCGDGMLVRYDEQTTSKPCVRGARTSKNLRDIAPTFSEEMVYFPEDRAAFVPAAHGPRMTCTFVDTAGSPQEAFTVRPVILASTALPVGVTLQPGSMRSLCLASMSNEFDFQLHGSTAVPDSLDPNAKSFIIRTLVALPVGWKAIECYPLMGAEYWKPEYAATWAELDLLAIATQQNLHDQKLRSLDSRADTRKAVVAMLDEFQRLLDGPEEPIHQFLKLNPGLLSPTHVRCWSKMRFGSHVSDFVFCEAPDDYELVEIEAPVRELFRQDGQQRQELTHAIDQIQNWLRYIGDNKKVVEEELGLAGISVSPRMLVVIGRSFDLTDDNRKKLAIIQSTIPKLRILTYDDLLVSARANFERILGPLGLDGPNVQFYAFKGPMPPL